MRDLPHLRIVQSPITADQLRPPSAECRTVQFSHPLAERDHAKLSNFVRKHPHLQLRVYGHFHKNVDFLEHYRNVRRLAVDVFEMENFDGLNHISADLDSLELGQTKSKALSLSFLPRFPKLRSLCVERHTKDIEAISSLSQLENLTLRSITLPDLSILRPLEHLHSLGLKLGGTTNLDLLPKIGRLRYIELWMIRGLDDLRSLSSVRTLQYLFLQALRNVEKLPSLTRLPLLRRLRLQTMKGLTDLRPAAKAPALEELMILEMPHLQPEAFRPFLQSRTLKRVSVEFGSDRQQNAVAHLLGLPKVEGTFTFQESGGRGWDGQLHSGG